MTEPLWRQLELLVAEIQRELAPGAEVTHNVRLKGRVSEQFRQVDVLVRQRIGQYEVIIAIDCKDYAVPVDVKGVEEFLGLVRDIGAHKGAMVSPKGFSAAAKKMAAAHQIDLFSPVDTDPHKWQVKPSLPTICDYRGVAMAFGISCSAPLPFMVPLNFFEEISVYDGAGALLGNPREVALRRWNEAEFPVEPGEYDGVPIFSADATFVDNGYGTQVPVTLTVSLQVTQRLFFGQLPIVKLRGLRDEQTGAIVTNAFTTGVLNPIEIEKTWQPLDSIDAAPTKPVLTVVGLDCYELTT